MKMSKAEKRAIVAEEIKEFKAKKNNSKEKKIKKESATPEKITKQEKTTEKDKTSEKERMTALLNRIDKVKSIFHQPPRPWLIDELEIFVGAVETNPKISMQCIVDVLAFKGYLREHGEVWTKHGQLFEK